MRVFTWQDIVADIDCSNPERRFFKLTTSNSTYSYTIEPAADYIHIALTSKGASNGGNYNLFINSKKITARPILRTEDWHRHQKREGVIHFGLRKPYSDARSQTPDTFYGSFEGVNIYGSILDLTAIKLDNQYSRLLAKELPFPDCLCRSGLSKDRTDICQDGSMRWDGLDSTELQLATLSDASLATLSDASVMSSGFWELPQPYVRLFLDLLEPSILRSITVYVGTPPPDIEALRGIGAPGQRLHLFCPRKASCQKRGKVVHEKSESQELAKLVWSSEEGEFIITKRLYLVFTSQGGVSDRIYEIILHGRILDPSFSDRQCMCFPGNGLKGETCQQCNQCVCRGGNMNLAGKQCKPYLTSLQPSYGPESGGSPLTIYGGLLTPLVDQAIVQTVVMIGDERCTNVTRNDREIVCETPQNQQGTRVLKVALLVGGAFYNVTSTLDFNYRPDPEIYDVKPYKSFLFGGHNITVTGRYFSSVHRRVLLVNVSIYGQILPAETGVCTGEDDSTMICSMPSIKGSVPVDAYIGFIMDGVTRYRNLSSALPDKGLFRMYPKPEFEDVEDGIFVRQGQKDIVLKGRNINACCGTSDYRVFIGSYPCEISQLQSDSLSCILPTPSPWEIGINYPIKIECLGITIDFGFIKYQPSSTIYPTLLGALGGVVLILILAVSAVTLIIIRRKRSISTDDAGSTAILHEMYSIEVEDQPSVLDGVAGGFKTVLQDVIIDCKNIQLHEEIGRGNFGVLYKGLLIDEDGEETNVALKTLKGDAIKDKRKLEEFVKEATITKGFDHSNVLSLLGVAVDEKSLYVVLPYMVNGDLRSFITNKDVQLTNFTGYMLDVARGMEYLSSKKFVHRDLAARNCMVDEIENVLIGDFGLARDIYQKDYYRPEKRKGALPYRWMAIESMEQGIFTSESDVWSFGVTMWEVFSAGIKPYTHVDNSFIQKYICQGNRLLQPPACPDYMFSLMSDCWLEVPSDRPKFSDLVSELEKFLQLGGKNAGRNSKHACDSNKTPSTHMPLTDTPWASSDDNQNVSPPAKKNMEGKCAKKLDTDIERGTENVKDSGLELCNIPQNLPPESPPKVLGPFRHFPGLSCSQGPSAVSCSQEPPESHEGGCKPVQRSRRDWGSFNVGPKSLQVGGTFRTDQVKRKVENDYMDMGAVKKQLPPRQVHVNCNIEIEDYLQPQ